MVVDAAVVQVYRAYLRLLRLLDCPRQRATVAAVERVALQDQLAIHHFADEWQAYLLAVQDLPVVDEHGLFKKQVHEGIAIHVSAELGELE